MDVMLLGTNGKWAAQKVRMWESEGEAWSEEESVSGGSREGNVCTDALHVIGLHGPGVKISLFWKDWELAEVALPHGPGHAVPGKCVRPGLLSRHECSSLTVEGL